MAYTNGRAGEACLAPTGGQGIGLCGRGMPRPYRREWQGFCHNELRTYAEFRPCRQALYKAPGGDLNYAASADPEDGFGNRAFGILRDDWAPRPAYAALV